MERGDKIHIISMITIGLIIIAFSINDNTKAVAAKKDSIYKMSSEKVHGYDFISRYENNEVFCYGRNGNGLQCFKKDKK